VFATLACSLASGIVFGFAALKPVLIEEGVYRDLCPPAINTTHTTFDIPCAEQDKRLNLFFVSSSIIGNASTFLAGVVLDRFGRRTCYIASAFFLATGSVVMGCAFTLPQFDGYILGNLLLSLGGTLLFVSSFQLADAFPKHSGTVVAMVTGAFDASAAVFLFYRMAYEASNGIFTPARFFFGYLIIPALIVVAELTFMPPHAYHDTAELEQKIERANDSTLDVHDSDDGISDDRELRRVRSVRAQRRADTLDQIEGLVGNSQERQERHDLVEERKAISGVPGALHDVPFRAQILSPWFILLLLLTVVQMLRMNYFISTIREQYLYMLGSESHARAINHFFDAALPTAGVISTPLIGLVLNNFSITTILSALTLFIAFIGILNCLPFLWAGYMTVLAFVLFRPLYYSVLS
jgi:MFS family permease